MVWLKVHSAVKWIYCSKYLHVYVSVHAYVYVIVCVCVNSTKESIYRKHIAISLSKEKYFLASIL